MVPPLQCGLGVRQVGAHVIGPGLQSQGLTKRIAGLLQAADPGEGDAEIVADGGRSGRLPRDAGEVRAIVEGCEHARVLSALGPEIVPEPIRSPICKAQPLEA